MKKIIWRIVLAITVSCVLFTGLSACGGFKKPISKEVLSSKKIDLFNDYNFNNIGLIPSRLVLNKDYSGYMVYHIADSAVNENIIKTINTALENINKKAYGEGDYQAGYRAVYVQEKNIKQAGENTVSVEIEFININYLKSGIIAQTLEQYLKDNYEDEINNNFTDTNTKDKTSIINIEDKQNTYIITYSGVTNQSPITVNGARIICYYGNAAEIGGDTAKFTTGNSYIIYVGLQLPLGLIISAFAMAALFAAALIIRLVKNNKK